MSDGRRSLGDKTTPREEQCGDSPCWELPSAPHRTSDSFALLNLADNFIFQPEAEETWGTSVLDLILTNQEKLFGTMNVTGTWEKVTASSWGV